MNLDELDKSFDRAEANADHEGVFLEQLFTAYPSLSAKIRAADKLVAAYNACDQNQNEETEQALIDALDEYEAIK